MSSYPFLLIRLTSISYGFSHETTSNGIAWALYYTLQNPWVYKVIAAEVMASSAGRTDHMRLSKLCPD